jgi:hypothetical protein
MKKLIAAALLAALFIPIPTIAGETKADKKNASNAASADGRGGLAEWPVSKEEADWSSAAAGSASGASGSDQSPDK